MCVHFHSRNAPFLSVYQIKIFENSVLMTEALRSPSSFFFFKQNELLNFFFDLFVWLCLVVVVARGVFLPHVGPWDLWSQRMDSVLAQGLSTCDILAWFCPGMWDLNYPTREGTHVRCIARRFLDHQGSSLILFFGMGWLHGVFLHECSGDRN